MPVILSAHRISKAFGARPLFEDLTLAVESGERIGLVGPNGAGKSTLLKILADRTAPDEGTVSRQKGLKVGFLEQVPEFAKDATVLSAILESCSDPDDWEAIAWAGELISRLGLSDGERVNEATSVALLSGGWKKRAALGRELFKKPDVLLLDEPTNHLDIESILWLERFISAAPFATITITHDRQFLQRVSSRIVELDRRHAGGILSVQGDYAAFLKAKEELLEAQEKRETTLKNTLRRETEWLRQGAKARTTKQQARIQRAEALGGEVRELEYRNQSRSAGIEFEASERQPKKLLEAKRIAKSYGDRVIFRDVDVILRPGTRLSLLGANGCGKSTLIRVLLGREKPDAGSVQASEHLKVAYFEQNRETLDPALSLVRTLCPSGDHVDYRGGRVHIRSYLDRFLFSQSQMDMAVGKLSGGEQSRILIAKLMLQDANLLVLDEPTNDLDVPTLNVLEDCLKDFGGAVLLVTHDRYFLDQVSTELLAFPAHGAREGELVRFASLDQYETWLLERAKEAAEPRRAPESGSAPAKPRDNRKPGKLGFKDQRELDQMERVIHEAEAELARLTEESQSPEILRQPSKLREITRAMSETQTKIDNLFARWSELESLKKG